MAAFAPDGALVFANHAALERVGGLITLAALGIEATARRARKFARDSRERGRRHERKAYRGDA